MEPAERFTNAVRREGIFAMHRGEFYPHSTSGPCIPQNGLGPNRAFLDKKLKPDRCTQGARLTRLEKQTSGTQISYR